MMKRKMMVPVVALLLCVAMVSVGFAAWIITGTVTEDASGQFQVYEVQSKTVDFTANVPSSDKVIFGATSYTPASGKTQWLTLEEGATEDLTATLTITINNYSSAVNEKVALKDEKVKITVSAVELVKTNDSGASFTEKDSAGKDYIVKPVEKTFWIKDEKIYSNENCSTEITDGSITFLSGEVTYNLAFGWGSAFKQGETNVNPINFYNDQEFSAALATQAETALGAIHALDNYTYTFSVTAEVVVD